MTIHTCKLLAEQNCAMIDSSREREEGNDFPFSAADGKAHLHLCDQSSCRIKDSFGQRDAIRRHTNKHHVPHQVLPESAPPSHPPFQNIRLYLFEHSIPANFPRFYVFRKPNKTPYTQYEVIRNQSPET